MTWCKIARTSMRHVTLLTRLSDLGPGCRSLWCQKRLGAFNSFDADLQHSPSLARFALSRSNAFFSFSYSINTFISVALSPVSITGLASLSSTGTLTRFIGAPQMACAIVSGSASILCTPPNVSSSFLLGMGLLSWKMTRVCQNAADV